MANPTTLHKADAMSVDLLASATKTATAAGDTNVGSEFYSSAIFMLDVTAASGTSPTLDVRIQTLLPDGATWQDIGAFAQATGTVKQAMSYVGGGNAVFTQGSGTLAAGTFKTFLMGRAVRAHWTIGGTNPSFTFSVSGTFLP